jgi:hypothetical protein
VQKELGDDELNAEYKGKPLDEEEYLEFWEDFTKTNVPESAQNRRGSASVQSGAALTDRLPSIQMRRTSMTGQKEDPLFTSKKTQIKKHEPTVDEEQPSAPQDSRAVEKLKMRVEALEKQIAAEKVNYKMEIKKQKAKFRDTYQVLLEERMMAT